MKAYEGTKDDISNLIQNWIDKKHIYEHGPMPKEEDPVLQDIRYLEEFFSIERTSSMNAEAERPIHSFLRAWMFGHQTRKAGLAAIDNTKEEIRRTTTQFGDVVTRARRATRQLLKLAGRNTYSEYIDLAWLGQTSIGMPSQQMGVK